MWISPLTTPGNFTLKDNNSLKILAFKSPLPPKISKDPPQGGNRFSRTTQWVTKVILPLLCFCIALLCDQEMTFLVTNSCLNLKNLKQWQYIPWPKVVGH